MAAIPFLDLSYGSRMTQEMRTKRVTFGDAYSQRATDGINAQPQRWQLVWNGITDDVAETLRLFFEERAGVEVIDWQPFNQTETLKWTNGPFQSAPAGFNTFNCSVVLSQEFDL